MKYSELSESKKKEAIELVKQASFSDCGKFTNNYFIKDLNRMLRANIMTFNYCYFGIIKATLHKSLKVSFKVNHRGKNKRTRLKLLNDRPYICKPSNKHFNRFSIEIYWYISEYWKTSQKHNIKGLVEYLNFHINKDIHEKITYFKNIDEAIHNYLIEFDTNYIFDIDYYGHISIDEIF